MYLSKVPVICYMFLYTRGCYYYFFSCYAKGKVKLLKGIDKLECFSTFVEILSQILKINEQNQPTMQENCVEVFVKKI